LKALIVCLINQNQRRVRKEKAINIGLRTILPFLFLVERKHHLPMGQTPQFFIYLFFLFGKPPQIGHRVAQPLLFFLFFFLFFLKLYYLY
jgi:hypothetical protein